MHRTQIYLPDELYQTLKKEASHTGVSMAELIRNSLKRRFSAQKNSKNKKNTAVQALLDIAGTASSKEGASDIARNHDTYLYE